MDLGSRCDEQIGFLLIGFPLYRWNLWKRDCCHKVWIYVYEIVLPGLTAAVGTVWQPHHACFTFMFLLLVLPLLILDRPWRIVLMITGVSVYFGIMAGLFTDPAVFQADMIHQLELCSVVEGVETERHNDSGRCQLPAGILLFQAGTG